MNRGEMRSKLRLLLYDRAGVTWSDAELDTQLDLSAQAVADDLAEHSRIPWLYSEYSFAGSSADITLTAVVDPYRILNLTCDQSQYGTEQVTPRDLSRRQESSDKDGRWYFALVNRPTPVFSPAFSDAFVKGCLHLLFKTAPGGTWTLKYCKALDSIPSGETYDQMRWSEIPAAFDEQIPLHAAAQLLGPRMEESSAVISQLYGFSRDKMLDASKSRSGPLRTNP